MSILVSIHWFSFQAWDPFLAHVASKKSHCRYEGKTRFLPVKRTTEDGAAIHAFIDGTFGSGHDDVTPKQFTHKMAENMQDSTFAELVSVWKSAIKNLFHYSDEITSAMASQITGVSIDYSTVCSGAEQRNHQSSASLAFVRGIHRWPANSPHKGQ